MQSVRSLAIVLTLLLSLASAAIATAVPSTTASPLARLAPDIGDTVTISNVDGDELGTVTLEEIVDPFTDFEEEPEPGLRFLSIELTVENTGENDLEIVTRNIGVVDDAGTIFTGVAVTRTDRTDELEDTTLEPGEDVTGALAVGFPEDGEIAQIVWFVDTGILPIIYNAAEPVSPGDTVILTSADYGDYEDVAELTVEELTDPLEAADAGRGLRAVGATISIENAGDEPFAPEPGSFYLGTTDGIFWSPDPAIEPADGALDPLTDDEIEPDDSITGFVGFAIPEEAEIAYLMYFSGGVKLVRIFDAETDDAGDDPTPEDKDNGGNLGPLGRDDEDEPPDADDNGNAGSGDECEGAAVWAEDSIARIQEWVDILSGIDFNDLDPAAIQDAADASADIAERQADSTPPPAAAELNELLVQAYEDTAAALNDIADAIESGDSAAGGEAGQRLSDIGTSFQEGEIAEALVAAEEVCPELSDL